MASTTWKRGIIPNKKNSTAKDLFICIKCGMKLYYYGNAIHNMNEPCIGCQQKKIKPQFKKTIIKRNNPGPYIQPKVFRN